MIVPFEGVSPEIHSDALIAPNATIIGDVSIGPRTSIWYQVVIRGDVFPIRIGAEVNIQDLCMIHVTTDRFQTTIGDRVTVGHGAILHGCTLEAGSFVGMGAVVMDDVVVGEGAIVGARSLVTAGTRIPPGHLAIGSPARVKRPLTEAEVRMVTASPGNYFKLAKRHAASTPGFGRRTA